MFADRMFKKWKELDEYLLVKYIDGNVKRQNPDGSFKDNGSGKNIPANRLIASIGLEIQNQKILLEVKSFEKTRRIRRRNRSVCKN